MTSGVDYAEILESQAEQLSDLQNIGSALVLAPHPDDESLGCGGTIARLRAMGHDVHVLFVSDGTLSHPNSQTYPAPRLRDLREQEARAALQILGVADNACSFMRLPDRHVPLPHEPGFAEAVAVVTTLIDQLKPTTVFMPWRCDPHPDHRASWHIGQAALANHPTPVRVLEYLIWLWELGTPADRPNSDEVRVWRVPISEVMVQRDQAIAAHQSQVTHLIDDDPTGFYLSPELLTHFARPRELFLETMPKNTLPQTYFDSVYQASADPWSFETSPYEREKYATTISVLPNERYQSAFEIGCSIGVLTQLIADRCDKLLAVDASELPLETARARLASYPSVAIEQMAVPDQFPDGTFDLMLLSEVGYYLSPPDLERARQWLVDHLQPGGHLLLVHWTPFVPDYPLTGAQVHDFFMETAQPGGPLQHLLNKRQETYRLDLFQKK